jgi:hypothetical protein
MPQKSKTKNRLQHQRAKSKKLSNRQLAKTPVTKSLKRKPNKSFKLSKKSLTFLRYAGMVVVGLLIVTFFSSYLGNSRDEASLTYNGVLISADNLLAYNEDQIAIADLVGTRKQLISEVAGYQSAPTDLQDYVLKDYRAFKKTCIANFQLLDDTKYFIKNVVYDKYALVSKYCDGVQNNILAKINDVWTVIYNGNALIPCSLVNDFSIPQGVSMRCTLNGTSYLNPNP